MVRLYRSGVHSIMTAARALDLSPDELAVRLQQQSLVADFGVMALSAGTLDAVLETACAVAAEGLHTRFSKVLRYRAASDDFLIVQGIGWHPGVVGHATLGGGLDSPAGYALHTGEPTRANDLENEARFKVPPVLAEHGIHSAINVPVRGGNGQHFGVLEVDSTNRHEFVAADMAFMQSLGNVLSAAVARCEAEEAKDALLQEKDLLMQEVHHRVKNSLQLVRTLLQLQARSAGAETRERLEEAAQRIMTIAAVHQRLYEGGSVAEAEAGAYLTALFEDMRALADGEAESRPISLDSDPIPLPADHVTPLGLIVSELVTNSLKYGEGAITVRLRRLEMAVEIIVEDEGPGFGEAALGKGLGMRLVTALAKGDAAQAVTVDRTVAHGRVRVILTLG